MFPHHHEAAKIGGIVRVLLAPDERGEPGNNIHAVVVMPSHRSITTSADFAKREDMIDAVNKEGSTGHTSSAYASAFRLGTSAADC